MGNIHKYKVGEIWRKGRYMMIKTGRKSERLNRYVMEQKIGRKLLTYEYVHHIDGNALNNEIGNLQIVTPLEHSIIHNKGRVPVNKGKPMSEEQKEKMRVIALARPPMSEETKVKISKTLKGRTSSRKGIIMSEEQKEKIRKSMLKTAGRKKREAEEFKQWQRLKKEAI